MRLSTMCRIEAREVPRGSSGRRGSGEAGARQNRDLQAADPAGAVRGAWALWGVLLLLTVVRAALVAVPSMWLWGINLLRFLPPVVGWSLWGLAAFALIPAFPARMGSMAPHPGRTAGRSLLADLFMYSACAIGGAALVWLFPDRLWFTGDFLMRRGTAFGIGDVRTLFPQATWLDLAIHYQLPRFLAKSLGVNIITTVRAIGALEAAVLGLLAAAFARALRLRGAAGAAVACVLFFGGYLGLFTGYNKSFCELCVLTAAVGLFGVLAMLEGRGLLQMGIALALALALHRSALVLLPPVFLAWFWWLRIHGRSALWRRPAAIVGIALPLAALALTAPQILRGIRLMDRQHLLPGSASPLGALGSALGGVHLADVGNVAMLLSPLAAVIPFLAVFVWPHLSRRRDGLLLLVLALPAAAIMLLVHPRQGMFRDWDVYAAGGVAVSLLAAWLVGETLRALPRRGWLAAAVMLAVAIPSMQWIIHNHDQDRGASRIEAFLREAPPRPSLERALGWDYLGVRGFGRGDYASAAEAYGRAAELIPSTRILISWSMAEACSGDYAKAGEVYLKLLGRPDGLQAWRGLAEGAVRSGDYVTAIQAARIVLYVQPDNAWASGMVERVRRGLEAAAPRK
jgi:hypothetical protein